MKNVRHNALNRLSAKSEKSALRQGIFKNSLLIVSFLVLGLCSITEIQAQDNTYTVRGTVYNEVDEPLEGVSIVLKGTNVWVESDRNGTFEFSKPLEANAILIFNYLGYQTKEYTITGGASQVVDITMRFTPTDISLMGEPAVDGVYTTKTNIFKRFAALFKK